MQAEELTEIIFIVDRSSSMNSIKDDMEGAIWTTIREQNELPGRCTCSLYLFDHEWSVAFEGLPAGDVRPEFVRIVPRGQTALYDAVVRSIAEAERRIMTMPEDARPKKVVVVVVTDGQNNASREATSEQASAALDRVNKKYAWQAIFLAATLEASMAHAQVTRGTGGQSVGIASARFDPKRPQLLVRGLRSSIGAYRGGGQAVLSYTNPNDDEKEPK